MTLVVDILNISINVLGATNYTIKVNLIKTRTEIAVLIPIIKTAVNKIFGDGVSIVTWLT